MDDSSASASPSQRSFIDHRGAPYLVLLVWFAVLVAAFGVGLEFVGAIESDPDCSWDSCIQPFVGLLFWLFMGGLVAGVVLT